MWARIWRRIGGAENSPDDLTPVVAWRASCDDSLHASAAEAAEWDADAGPRAERDAEDAARSRALLDAHLAEARARNEAQAARLLPRVEALHARLDPDRCPRLYSTIDWALDDGRRTPADGMSHTVSVWLVELAWLVAPDEADRIEAAWAVGDDYDRPYEERAAAAAELVALVRPRLADGVLAERVDSEERFSGYGFGVGLGVSIEEFLDALPTLP